MFKEIAYVFLGGGIGSVLRYLIHVCMNTALSTHIFPWSTFTINTTGSLIIGILYTYLLRFPASDEIRLLLMVGFCGGFTTFSTFSNEGVQLLKEGFYGTYFMYAFLSIGTGLLAVWLGITIGKYILK